MRLLRVGIHTGEVNSLRRRGDPARATTLLLRSTYISPILYIHVYIYVTHAIYLYKGYYIFYPFGQLIDVHLGATCIPVSHVAPPSRVAQVPEIPVNSRTFSRCNLSLLPIHPPKPPSQLLARREREREPRRAASVLAYIGGRTSGDLNWKAPRARCVTCHRERC